MKDSELTPKEILKKYWGYDGFRENQEQAIQDLLDNKPVVYVEKTGGGKSVCYQIPAMMGKGLTIVVSPLKSLMKDQVDGLVKKGIRATFLNSDLKEPEYKERYRQVATGEYKLLYVSPEKMCTESFLKMLKTLVDGIDYLIIDEFDTVNEYGSSGFRPEYLKMGHIKQELQDNQKHDIIVGIFTATATPQVIDLVANMMDLKEYSLYKGKLLGDNLTIQVTKFNTKEEKDIMFYAYIKHIANHLKTNGGSGVIFCSTTKNVDNIYKLLKDKFNIVRYHSGMTTGMKESSFNKFLTGKTQLIVCTNAFGRGVDKSDIRYIVHYGIPGNVSSFLQEVGRGGRDGKNFNSVCLYGFDDIKLREFLHSASERPELNKVVDFLGDTDTCRLVGLENYFEYEHIHPIPCGQCDNCRSKRLVSIDESDLEHFKVVKVKRASPKKKVTTTRKKTTTKKTVAKKTVVKKTTVKKPVTKTTTTVKKPVVKAKPVTTSVKVGVRTQVAARPLAKK